ncbi:MAG TPA: hypothetical protein VD931_04935 [Baekduia sp.]|nr:hypothetical protein [Baekduia sp.]
MTTRRIAVVAATVAAIAAGSVGAIAATSKDEAKKREDAVLGDAAKRLDVEPSELRSALRAAQDAQLDQAVEDGELTKQQAERIKQARRTSGLVLGGPHGGPRGYGRHGGPGGRHAGGRVVMDAVAKALGLTPAQLHDRLHDGDTLAEIAKDRGKDLADVRAAARKALADHLAGEVQAKRLTDAQRDEILQHFDDDADEFGTRGFGRGRGPGGPMGRGHHGP